MIPNDFDLGLENRISKCGYPNPTTVCFAARILVYTVGSEYSSRFPRASDEFRERSEKTPTTFR